MKYLVITLVVFAPFANVGAVIVAFRWANAVFCKLREIVLRIEQTSFGKEARQFRDVGDYVGYRRMDPRGSRILAALDDLRALEMALRKAGRPAFEPKNVFMSSTLCLVMYFGALVIGNLDGVDYSRVIHYPIVYLVSTAMLLIWIVAKVKKLESRLAPVLTRVLETFRTEDRFAIHKAIDDLERLKS